MFILIIIALVFGMWISVCVRLTCFHLLAATIYVIKDLLNYIKQKGYNKVKTGQINAYVGLFGRGKTLSAVHKVTNIYKKKNNKQVWCPERKCLVTQKIKVISNVSLNIPYEQFVSLEQVVRCAEKNKEVDILNGTLTVTLVLGDEFSVQMNSRSFKSNINPLFLNTLLTCRHHHISLYYTAQRFGHVDALLRQVTSLVVDCRKTWRYQVQYIYDAWDMENALNPRMIKPLRRTGFFVKDRDYNAYDTLACVNNLKKSFDENDMLTEEEILQLQCNVEGNMDVVTKVSRRYKKRMKGKK